ncbi:MAG: hypoxanthine phosphoribosyltransferase [Fimbriimonadaceae bacterium]|nr:hypoxanthine phosphoribosyltransferase [Fimbriimonadaceae bacterium]
MALDIIITEDQIQARVRALADELNQNLPSDGAVVLLGVLKGSYPFIADLSRAMGRDVMVDFVQVSSYGSGKSSTGVVQIKKDHDINIEGTHVVIVEDIVDTGLTLSHLRQLLLTRHPASLRVVSMLSKPAAREHSVPVEHVGFEIENLFVVGYGLDYAERYRNLPFIAVLRE